MRSGSGTILSAYVMYTLNDGCPAAMSSDIWAGTSSCTSVTIMWSPKSTTESCPARRERASITDGKSSPRR